MILNFRMWFKYGLKARKLLEAARPERACGVNVRKFNSVFLQQEPKDFIDYGMETTDIQQAFRTGA